MSTQKNLMTLCFATVFTLGLAACGGGGGDAPVAGMMDDTDTDDTMTSSLVGKIFPDGTVVPLPPGSTGDATLTYMAIEGESLTVVDVGTFECVTGPCMVVVANDAITSTGVIKVGSLVDDIPAVVLAALEAKAEDEPAPLTVLELFATAQDSRDAAAAAAKAAGDAVKAAMDASGKLTTLAVKGDSMTATANAQAVLDMQAATVKAAMDAETALQEAKDALEEADETAADNVALIAALDAAIEAAEADVKTATDARDSVDLKTAVELVTGDDEDMQMSAADHGQMVAMAIGGALGPGAEGAGTRVVHVDDPTTDPPLADDDKTAVRMDDHTGKTWAEIVGDDALVDMRIAAAAAANRAVKAMSFADMARTSITDETLDEDATNDGAQYVGAYKGIDGVVFCAGTDCKVTDDKLAGSWYFTTNAENAETYYEMVDEDADYTPETSYAQFGHWLTMDGNAATVRTYAMTGHDGADFNVMTVNEDTTLTDKSATYEGTAVGMSLHKEVDSDGAPVPGTLQSGTFTAAVTLTAKFQDTPMLGGYINGFKGNAVDEDWRVTLVEGDFAAAMLTGGTTIATGQDGVWSATGYGNAAERPTGIFGGFNAHFSDGHAAGAYATRK